MNITITGSLGNVGHSLAGILVSKGHHVTVISHDPQKKAAIEGIGATAAIGSIRNYEFLLQAFAGADAVFTMIPPDPAATDIPGYIRETGDIYTNAIGQAGIKYVVNLSSIGADMPDGPGPTGANYHVENRFNALKDTHVLHLRPGMFYTNFFGAMVPIRYQGVIGNNFSASDNMVMSHPRDIAEAAAHALDSLSFSGKDFLYIASDEKSGREIAATLGSAIGKPDLAWVQLSDADLLQALQQSGMTEVMAQVYVIEIGIAIREGRLFEHYRKNKDKAFGKTGLQEFAVEFAVLYNSIS